MTLIPVLSVGLVLIAALSRLSVFKEALQDPVARFDDAIDNQQDIMTVHCCKGALSFLFP
jgi:hypothetical protein